MNKALIVLAVLMFAPLLSGCAGNPVQESMASLERAYIPALMLTSEKDLTGQNVMALKQLKLEWSVFRSKNPAFADEGGSAYAVEAIVTEADNFINCCSNLAIQARSEAFSATSSEMRSSSFCSFVSVIILYPGMCLVSADTCCHDFATLLQGN